MCCTVLPSETCWLQEKAAALEALVAGRRTAKQTEADTIASTIRQAAEQRKAAVNDWVNGRTELREMVSSASNRQAADRALGGSTEDHRVADGTANATRWRTG